MFCLSLWTEFAFKFCFLWVLLVGGRKCVCVPCLRYPRKGKMPPVYIIKYIFNGINYTKGLFRPTGSETKWEVYCCYHLVRCSH